MGRVPLVFYHNAYGNSGAANWDYEKHYDNLKSNYLIADLFKTKSAIMLMPSHKQ